MTDTAPTPNLLENIQSLTFDELEELERITGEPFGTTIQTMADGLGGMRASVLKAFAWLVARRDDPGLTLEAMGSHPALAGMLAAGEELAKKEPAAMNGPP